MSSELEIVKSGISDNGSLILGAGLAVASLILIPAVATRIGLGASLTGALRMAMMRASSRVANGKGKSQEDGPVDMCCH